MLNPRQDGRGKWLKGMVLHVQRLEPANYLVDVSGQPRYVHIEHLRSRNPESVPIGGDSMDMEIATSTAPVVPVRGVLEKAGEEPTSTNTPDERQGSLKETTNHPWYQ